MIENMGWRNGGGGLAIGSLWFESGFGWREGEMGKGLREERGRWQPFFDRQNVRIRICQISRSIHHLVRLRGLGNGWKQRDDRARG